MSFGFVLLLRKPHRAIQNGYCALELEREMSYGKERRDNGNSGIHSGMHSMGVNLSGD